MQNKIAYPIIIVLLIFISYLFIQNKTLSEQLHMTVAIQNYKSYTYYRTLKDKQYEKLELYLKEDIKQLVSDYNEKLYLKNPLLKHICNDVDQLKKILDMNTTVEKIGVIKKDCRLIH